MEEITFEDILTHYELKLKESSENLQSVSQSIKKSISVIDSGWKGSAADTCRIKLEDIVLDIGKIQGNISDAMTKLSVIGELLADSETTLV